ncbi:hypothetical protein Tco_1439515 [Tanacetum coccineum]
MIRLATKWDHREQSPVGPNCYPTIGRRLPKTRITMMQPSDTTCKWLNGSVASFVQTLEESKLVGDLTLAELDLVNGKLLESESVHMCDPQSVLEYEDSSSEVDFRRMVRLELLRKVKLAGGIRVNSELAFYGLGFMARWIVCGEIARPPVLLSADKGLGVTTAGRNYNSNLLDGTWAILNRSPRQKKVPIQESYLTKVSSFGNFQKDLSSLHEFEMAVLFFYLFVITANLMKSVLWVVKRSSRNMEYQTPRPNILLVSSKYDDSLAKPLIHQFQAMTSAEEENDDDDLPYPKFRKFKQMAAEIIKKHEEQAFPSSSSQIESTQSYQPPHDSIMGPPVYPPAQQNPPPFYKPDYQFGYPQGKSKIFNGGYGEYHNSQWTLPPAWTESGVMLVLPSDPGLWSEVISRWESITINRLNNQTWSDNKAKLAFVENLLGESEKLMWQQWRTAYPGAASLLLEAMQMNHKNKTTQDLDRITCEDTKNLWSFLEDFRQLATKSGRLYFPSTTEKLFAKLPPSLSKKIEESFRAKHPGLSSGVLPAIKFTHTFVSEMCKDATLAKELRDLSLCSAIPIPGYYKNNRKKYGMRKSRTYKGKPHNSHVKPFKRKYKDDRGRIEPSLLSLLVIQGGT